MRRVLVLNATFEPLQLVSSRRAVLLLLDGRAETVAVGDDPEVLHSPSVNVEVPSIVRLFHVARLGHRRRTPPVTRRAVLLRDGSRCAYCGEHADTIDHIIPRSRGGAHEWTNVVAACRRHNMEKGDRYLHEIARLNRSQRHLQGV